MKQKSKIKEYRQIRISKEADQKVELFAARNPDITKFEAASILIMQSI